MPQERIAPISIISILMIALFLLGIFTFSFLFPSPITTFTMNSTLPLPELNSTTHRTVINSNEPPPSFTGTIIVGITRPVTILGADGFSLSNISIKVGDSITWMNDDHEGKRLVLIFQRGREQNKFFSSPALWPEEEWEYTFGEEGEYNYWTTAYGVEGKVTVAPCKNQFCPINE